VSGIRVEVLTKTYPGAGGPRWAGSACQWNLARSWALSARTVLPDNRWRPLELDEVVEHFTLRPDEVHLLRGKSGPTRPGFGLVLKFLTWKGHFPHGGWKLHRQRQFAARQASRSEAGGIPPIFLSEHRYQLAFRRAEHTWLVIFTEALRTGTISWPAPPGKD
jgi:hypothetical protein